ncbi:MAG: M28 family peptidase [Gemmataceae bacterium]
MTIMRGVWGAVALAVALAATGSAATREELNRAAVERMRKDIFFLASPQCEGRGATTKGLKRAGDYIAAEFKRIGLKPGYQGGYFQPYAIAGAVGSLELVGPQGQKITLKQGAQFIPLGHDQKGVAAGPLVFAGYGVSCSDPEYDDYAGLDVKGKVVVLLRDTPRSAPTGRTKEMVEAASFSAKLTLAKKRGAAGALFVNDADTAADGDAPADFSFAPVMRGGSHIPAATMRRDLLDRMLPPNLQLGAIEKAIDHDLKPRSRELPGWSARLAVERKADAIPLRNVVGVLDGSGPLANETVVVGAHYDHLGYGGPSSNAPSKKRAIHLGADDNGSGTTAMMELARRFADQRQRQGRRLVFIAFSGEELGLFGSAHYCKEPVFPLADTASMFNLDMVGRLTKDKETGLDRVLTEGHGTAKGFKELIDGQAKKRGFLLKSQESGFGPSDHASFCGKKVPVLFVWTGVHEDYHKPSDTADKINLEGMRRVVDMGEEIVERLATMARPAFVEVKGAPIGRPSSGPRLGIRPGYGGEEGVEVESVTSGGAAEKAGMQGGDRIVEIAGKPVKNINEYMQAMATRKKGDKIDVIVIRAKERKTLKVNLE